MTVTTRSFFSEPAITAVSEPGRTAMPVAFPPARRRHSASPWLLTAITVLALTGAEVILQAAVAQPPDNADPLLAPWFQSLRQPGTGISCCSIADCRLTDYRTTDHGYEALVNGQWLDVPPEKVLQRVGNPTGRAVVCYTPGSGILCFVRPSEA